MNEELIAKMQTAITDLPIDLVGSFHARFIAYLAAGLSDELSAEGHVEFGHCDAIALQGAWRSRQV